MNEAREANHFHEPVQTMTLKELLAHGLIEIGLWGQVVIIACNILTFALYLGAEGPYVSWWWMAPLVALVVVGGCLRPRNRRSS